MSQLTLPKLWSNAVIRESSLVLGQLADYQRKLILHFQGPGDMLGLVSAE